MDFKPKRYLVIRWKATSDQDGWYEDALRYAYNFTAGKETKFCDGLTLARLLPVRQFEVIKDYGWIDTYDAEEEVHLRYKREYPPKPSKPKRDGAWIDRNGGFFHCPFMSHYVVALQLAISFYGANEYVFTPDEILLKKGWIQLWYTGQAHFEKPLTVAQSKTMNRLLSMVDDPEYKEMIELALKKSGKLSQHKDDFDETMVLLGGKK